jgi:hypothetical protein
MASRRRDAETSRNGGPTKVTALARPRPAGSVRDPRCCFASDGAQFRAVATRCAKRELIHKGTMDVASIRIWLCDPP